MATADIRFHPIVAALYDPVQVYFEHVQAPEHRRYLADGLTGRVLEVGVGTGAMLPYYEAAIGEAANVHGVEPDPGMWRRTLSKLDEYDVEMELVSARAESLPYDDGTFDHVLEVGLLCSVPSIEEALAEIRRVLAPGGEFRFFDHVRSDGAVGRSQDALTPVWRRFGGNCHLNRRIRPTIEGTDGFRIREVDRPTVGYWPIREFVRGVAVRTEP